jgi:hypothetical protein
MKDFNKFRHVGYEDGVNSYQCLKCKHYFGMCYGLGQFCTFCGTKWDDQHLYTSTDNTFVPAAKAQYLWIIQSRIRNWPDAEWEDYILFNNFKSNAKDIINWLHFYRQTEDHMDWKICLRLPKNENEAKIVDWEMC